MQLKLRRSQRGGLTKVIFCLDARVEFDAVERQNIKRYKLHSQVIYNSEASQKHLAQAAASASTGSMVGSLKSLGSLAFAAMNLNISIQSLERGQHVECKSLDELLGAEEAILDACKNLRMFLDTAATFDGREVLFDFSTGQAEVVATAVTPAPMPAAPARTVHAPPSTLPQLPPPASAPDALPQYELVDGEAMPLPSVAATAPAATSRRPFDAARGNRMSEEQISLAFGAVVVIVVVVVLVLNYGAHG